MSNPRQSNGSITNHQQHQQMDPNQNYRYQQQWANRAQQPQPSSQFTASRMRTNSDCSNGGAQRPPSQSNWESENEKNQAKIKLQKNSKTIFNHKQHIQSTKDRSHSGGGTQIQQSQYYGNSLTNVDRQNFAQQQLRTNMNYSTNNQSESNQVLHESTLIRNNSQNIQQRNYKHHQQQLEQLLVQNNKAVHQINNSEAQCEPFEIQKEQEVIPPPQNRVNQQSPYFIKQIKNQNYQQSNDVESIVGTCGQATSTFGYQQNYNQGNIPNVQYREPLKNEETMGITNQVQQIIEQRGQEVSQYNQELVQQERQKENNIAHNQKPQLNMQKVKQNISISKLNMNQIIKSPSANLQQTNQKDQKNTSRNSTKGKQIIAQNKSVILKPQKSVNDFKPVLSTSTRNSQMSKEGVVSVKKIKIKLGDGQNPKSSRRSNVNGASTQNLNQSQLSQKKACITPTAAQQNLNLSHQASSSSVTRARQGNHVGQQQVRRPVNEKKTTSKDPSPVHIHYHNLNYIQVINKNPQNQPSQDVVNLAQIQSSQQKLQQLHLGQKQKSVPKQKQEVKKSTGLIKNTSNSNIGTNRQSSSIGPSSSTPTGKNVSINLGKKRNQAETINASRKSSNSKPKFQREGEKVKNNSPNFNNISTIQKRGVDESFVHNLQDSLLKQQYNQQSLMTDSLDGTERKAYMQAQSKENVPSLNHSLSQRMKFPSPNPSPKQAMQNSQQGKQKVSLTKREELVHQLAKFIRFNDEDNKGLTNDQRKQNSLFRDEVIQENLKKFLQYLELKQVININEIQRDKTQMNNLVQDIMKIDFDQLQNPDFMNDKLDQMSQMQVKKTNQNVRSASGASHSSQYKAQGYGSTSGNETSKNYRSNSNNQDLKNQYNTSGTIKIPNQNSSKERIVNNRSNSGTEQKYFSASQTSNGNMTPFVISKHVKPQIDSTTATSGVDANGNTGFKNKVSQESLRRSGTPNTSNQNRFSNQNNNQASNQYIAQKQEQRTSVISNNSQNRLQTSTSQLSNRYNSSGDQVKILNTSGMNQQTSGPSRQNIQESIATQASQISNQQAQQAQQVKYNNFFQQKNQNQAAANGGGHNPQQQQVHNTTINLQINANVENVNITKQEQPIPIHQQIQNRILNSSLENKSKSGPKIVSQQQKQVQNGGYASQQSTSQTKAVNQSKVVSSNSSLFVNPNGIAVKQKRGGSHEEQTRDRMKQLLQDGSQHNVESSRAATAQANQKAFGTSQNKQQTVQKRTNSASAIATKERSRSIHIKQEHIEESKKQKYNDEIMMERDKIIKFNKQYMRKYHKFPPTVLDYYKFVKKIGKGAFGEVYLAIHKLTGKYVAIKMIELSQLKDKYSKKKVFQEVYILKKIRHSNIIRLYEVFENKKHIMMVMEYAGGGDLYHLVKKSGHLTEDETKYIFKNIAQGVAHCHCRSVLHRDIKLDNILLDGEGGVKICDFGVSRLVTLNELIQEQCGTPAYLAPEMSCNSKYHGFYVDIWSLGILLYVMLQGTVPFKASTMENLYKCQLKMKIEFPIEISPEAENLIKRMLVIKPEDRISFPELFCHSWLKNIIGPDGLPLEGQGEEHDNHDFQMSLSFQRQECNLNPLSVNVSSKNGDMTDRFKNALGNGEAEKQNQMHNINVIKVENMFYNAQSNKCKLQYSTYCAVTQDFNTYRIDEDAIRVLEQFGYPRQEVIQSINSGELNHATCCYNLLVMN